MAYSDIYLKRDKKIPTLLAILIACFVGLFFIRLFTQTAVPSKAEKKTVKRLEITNISSNQTAIYWQTDRKTVGWLLYGDKENRVNIPVYDDRDLLQNKLGYMNHYVTVKHLKENQTYFFKLVNDNKLEDNGNLPFTFKTRENEKDFKGRNPAYGKVIQANGLPLENAVVILRVEKDSLFSSLSKSTGEWLIPLNGITTSADEKVTIEIIGEQENSQVVTDLSNVSPLPQTIIIGKNFDFTSSNDVLSATSMTAPSSTNKEIDILYPRENALIPGYMPLIKGMAVPNSDVIITVQSSTILTSRVKADNKGLWSLNLPSSLSPGDHTITIKTLDRTGNQVTLQRKFFIAKNGEQVLGSATPEGTITESPETPTPTTGVYMSPTQPLTPTPPVSGNNITIPFAGAASLIIVGLGLMLVF